MARISSAQRLELAARQLDAGSCITIVRQARPTARGYAYRLSLLVRREHEEDLREMIDGLCVPGHIAPISARGVRHYQLSWHGQAAADVLEAALPWLDDRAKEARLALKFWEQGGMSGTYGPAPDELWAKRDALYVAMRDLKADLGRRGATNSLR